MKTSKDTDLFALPKEIVVIAETLKKAKFEAYLIGGCVRDTLLKRRPKDWDFTTNAKPEEIIKLFPKTFYENEYGTVGVVNEETQDETLKIVEVTPYRLESGYSDKRRPDSVRFSGKLEDDLKRRDFTINAIALEVKEKEKDTDLYKGHLVDLYKGQGDLIAKVVRTVGDPHERFSEDALRMLRAVRISTDLGFTINIETETAIKKYARHLKEIAQERIREEFVRIIMSDNPMNGLILSHKLGILEFVSPELEKAVGVEQNQAHSFDVWEHSLRCLQHAADKKWPLEIRLAALFHDISKPETRRASPETKWTFYGHDVVGSRVTERILARLAFPKKIVEKVVKLVRWHMFFSDTEQITPSAVRRLITKVGQDNVWDLMNLRICDRVGTGRPKENPYRLRKYKAMIEEVMRDPVSVAMLKIDGNKIMNVTHVTPGPKIGHILHALLEEVLENPKLNTEAYLEKRALELALVSDETLKKVADKGRETKGALEERSIKEIRGRYHVE
ncbi:MAG: HD domain-containing protein [Candidatus Taylorbacteria bacterium]|nr:HD domain-containing protein [Candidatus Taylorbacteria bacterium]